MNTTERGREGELIASRILLCNGFELIEKNWHCRYGEIDIIAKRRQVLHFVEVKYRKSSHGNARHPIISSLKLMKLRKSVYEYVNTQDILWQIDAMYIFRHGKSVYCKARLVTKNY